MRLSRPLDTHVIVVIGLGELWAVEHLGPGVFKLLEEGEAAAADALAEGSAGPDQHLRGGRLSHAHWHIREAEKKLEKK